jgi:tetraprenyl-beta-curcumene synthase
VCLRGLSAQPSSRATAAVSQHAARLSAKQLSVLAHAAWRELFWGLGAVSQEVCAWRKLASEIPTSAIREDALIALGTKRGHTDGAALFSILPHKRNRHLLRLLVAYELIWDFLDTVNEHGASSGQANGCQLHVALVDALDSRRPISDYYSHHPWKDDGGYLRRLVEVCRENADALPSIERVRPLLLAEATRAQVLGINHELDQRRRDQALHDWAAQQPADAALDVTWFELTGAASASLTVHALLALAADAFCSETEIAATRGAYFPWISAATTMLDSYVDQVEDAANADHSYIAHYPTPAVAVRRTSQLVGRSLCEASVLPNGERHVLIVACMVAMYLSKDSAHTPAMQETTRALIDAGGPLTKLLLPILRLWRIAYAQRSL